jgi:hypothetical protein
LDSAVKRLIEDAATEYCDGNVSAYVRGLVVFQSLLSGRDTQDADIPGWMLKMFPLQLIDRLQKEISGYHKTRQAMETFAQKQFYKRVSPAENPSQIVRINEMARELGVRARAVIDLLPRFGVTEKKTHSSSIPTEVAEKVRQALTAHK